MVVGEEEMGRRLEWNECHIQRKQKWQLGSTIIGNPATDLHRFIFLLLSYVVIIPHIPHRSCQKPLVELADTMISIKTSIKPFRQPFVPSVVRQVPMTIQ
jgi:hypothetical protein